MIRRVGAIAFNTYREAVRARILIGLIGVALATVAYSLVIATLSLGSDARVIADIGSGSLSLYASVVAIILGATSLYREVELKTIFPILTRKLRRYEFVLGKFIGTLATITIFIAIDAGTVCAVLALQTGQNMAVVGACVGAATVAVALSLWLLKRSQLLALATIAIAYFVAMAALSATAGAERQLVLVQALLTFFEAGIVIAVATLFASFSSPFLTALLATGIFIAGRSADTLAHLPALSFGETIAAMGRAVARILPNLQAYVPPRPVLLGYLPDVSLRNYVALAGTQAILYTASLLAVSAVIFQRRDFQ